MTLELLLTATLASAIVVITPGPAVVAALNLGAAKGRRAGAGFIFGHLAGDIVWSTLALIALVGVNLLPSVFFKVLGLVCGSYLAYLGLKALGARKKDEARALSNHHPVIFGLIFGLSNPKSYPVTLSLFAALLGSQLVNLDVKSAPLFLLFCLLGFVLADFVLIYLIGLGAISRFYKWHQLWVTRATGLLFLFFAYGIFRHSLAI
ncbi:MAG: LysE family transporter [Trueperaceae bacterium]|nr:LysE family transporter [Trueperaceae bacterium]